MPITPLPPDNTARGYVSYLAHGIRHEVQIRPITGFTAGQALAWLYDVLNAHKALFTTETSFDSSYIALQNSNVKNTSPWAPTITGTGGVPTAVDRTARSLVFTGRSAQGRQSKMQFYGTVIGPDASFRINAVENATVASFITALNALNARAGDITGSALVFKPYANVTLNSYWERELRS